MPDRSYANELQRLIAAYLADNPDETYSSIARRGGLKRTTVQSVAERPSPNYHPRDETIRGLALGMGMTPDTIRRAARLAPTGGGPEAVTDAELALLLDLARGLDKEKREALIRRARALRREAEEEAGGTS